MAMQKVHESIVIERPVAEVFAFHKRPQNLAKISPGGVKVKVVSADDPMQNGSKIHVNFYFGPLPLPWVSEVEDYEEGVRFTEVQKKGPFRHWRHQHIFEETDEGHTRLVEILDYEVPFGGLGVAAAKMFMGGMSLDEIFQRRQANTKTLLESQGGDA